MKYNLKLNSNLSTLYIWQLRSYLVFGNILRMMFFKNFIFFLKMNFFLYFWIVLMYWC